jgi:hypothetical protein
MHLTDSFEDKIYVEILVGKPEEEKPLGRPRHRWETNTVFSSVAA